MLFGYARVSTEEQNLDRQLDALKNEGVDKRNIYQEKITGTKKDRPELQKLLNYATEGDTIIVPDLTRLSRSTKDLIALVDELAARHINLKSIKDTWMDTTTAQGRLIFTIMAGMSQFERDLISERTKEGLASARSRGKLGGRREKMDSKKKQTIIQLYSEKKMTVKEICEMFDISKPTLYKIVRES